MKKTIISCVCSMLFIIVVQAQNQTPPIDTVSFVVYEGLEGEKLFYVDTVENLVIEEVVLYNQTGENLSRNFLYRINQVGQVNFVSDVKWYYPYCGLLKESRQKTVSYISSAGTVTRDVTIKTVTSYFWRGYICLFFSLVCFFVGPRIDFMGTKRDKSLLWVMVFGFSVLVNLVIWSSIGEMDTLISETGSINGSFLVSIIIMLLAVYRTARVQANTKN